jgi:hypothetical protein
MAGGKARRSLALIEPASKYSNRSNRRPWRTLDTLRVSAPSGVKHPTRRGLRVDPRREGKQLRWDRDTPPLSIWSGSPVTWRKLARLGIARSGRPSARERSPGASTRSPRPIPVGPQAGWTQGARTACNRQEHGVDVSSGPSEPPMGSLHRLQGEPRPRTAHLAPEAGSG